MSGKPEELTPKQQEVLNYMRTFFIDNDQLPTCEAISAHFGWSSPNAAQSHLTALYSKGQLEHNALGKYRFARPARRGSGR